jgi:quercetin dioxygenase-like cupin family protein
VTTSSRPPVLRPHGEGRVIAIVGDVYRFLATGAETDGKYATFEAVVPPGGGPLPHTHSREEESFYVLDGEITFTVNGERVVAGPGAFANMPVGPLHAFKNESSRTARMLISVAPAGLEEMFFEIGTPLPPGLTTAPPPTPEEIDKLLPAAPRYGIEIMPPPAGGDGVPLEVIPVASRRPPSRRDSTARPCTRRDHETKSPNGSGLRLHPAGCGAEA